MIERLLAADAALDRDDLEVAQRLFGQVADADPRNAIAVVGLARVAARSNAPGVARSLALRALDIDPEEAAARRLLDELDAGANANAEAPSTTSIPVAATATPEAASVAAPATAPAPTVGVPRSLWRRIVDRFLRRG